MNDKYLSILYKSFLSFMGAIVYRIRGGLEPNLPRPFDQLVFALGYGVVVYKASPKRYKPYTFVSIVILSMLALATGHGQYMDLAHVDKITKPETLDFIVNAVFGPDNFNNYWRDFFGLVVTGVFASLPAGVGLLIFKQWLPGVIIGLSGALKAVAYAIGWGVGLGTVGGEYLTGFFLWGVLALCWGMIKDADLGGTEG